jgi:hypothetical protein
MPDAGTPWQRHQRHQRPTDTGSGFGIGDMLAGIANGLTASQRNANAQYAQLNAANQMPQAPAPSIGDLMAAGVLHAPMVLGRQPIVKVMVEIIQLGRRTADTSQPHLIEGILPRSGVCVVAGPPDLQAALIFDMMIHVALGSPYRGRAVSQGAVVYIDIEGRANRVTSFFGATGLSRERGIPFYLISNIDLATEASDVIDAIQEAWIRPVAIVLDGPCEREAADVIRSAFNASALTLNGRTTVGEIRLGTSTHIDVRLDAAGNIVATVEGADRAHWAEFHSTIKTVEVPRGLVSGDRITAGLIGTLSKSPDA